MAHSYTMTWQAATEGAIIEAHKTFSADSKSRLEQALTAGQTDLAILFPIDVSQVKFLMITCDQDCLIETNSSDSGARDYSISLVADRPYEWDEDSYDSLLLRTDVVTIYATNLSEDTAATLKIEVLHDPTV